MNFCEVKYQINTANYDTIFEHLTLCSSSFNPPLETYVDIKNYARKILNFATIFEAIHEGKLVGLAAAYFNNHESKTSFLTNLSLLENYQGKSIASKLMREVFFYGRENGFTRIDLKAKIANQHAVSFYKKLGFIETGFDQDCFAMSIWLKSETHG